MNTSDLTDLLKLFNEFGVKYLIVGGHAVMLYTEPRYTKDLDLWIEASPDNADRVYRALAQFGAPLEDISAADFASPGIFYQLGRPPLRVDILMSLDGVNFSQAWPRRVEAAFGDVAGQYINRSDLISNKRATGRYIDLHDVELLEKSGADFSSPDNDPK